MSLSREAQVLADLLTQYPDALSELLRYELSPEIPALAPTPGLTAVRVLRPWQLVGAGSWHRLELVHSLRVALVHPVSALPASVRLQGQGPQTREPWVGYAWDLGAGSLAPRIEVGGEPTLEGCRSLVDKALEQGRHGPRWRLL